MASLVNSIKGFKTDTTSHAVPKIMIHSMRPVLPLYIYKITMKES